MEKPVCTHPLTEIQAQMVSVDTMNLTLSAQGGIRDLGISKEQALEVIRQLAGVDFHKSMDSEKMPGCWQDVYRPWFLATQLYVKIGRNDVLAEYVVISFKEK